jgi:inhibitor of KinA
MQLLPLGDQAVLAYCRDEEAAGRFAHQVRGALLPWVVDVVQAYTSVAVFYELATIDFSEAARRLLLTDNTDTPEATSGRFFTIPCCYELGLDWPRLEELTGLAAANVIELHCQSVYTVYAIGFCPGFPYLGYVAGPIAGVPRLPAPRLRVAAGSVGLTGRQTGIYTEERPGGWNILGRTPLELVNVRDGYFPLRTGDRVQFQPIDEATFHQRVGERLPAGIPKEEPINSAGPAGPPYNDDNRLNS